MASYTGPGVFTVKDLSCKELFSVDKGGVRRFSDEKSTGVLPSLSRTIGDRRSM